MADRTLQTLSRNVCVKEFSKKEDEVLLTIPSSQWITLVVQLNMMDASCISIKKKNPQILSSDELLDILWVEPTEMI